MDYKERLDYLSKRLSEKKKENKELADAAIEETKKKIKEYEKSDSEKEKRGGLEKIDADDFLEWYKNKNLRIIFGIGGLLALLFGIFFLSPNLTGNSVGDLTQNSSSLIGGFLFVLGLVGVYFWKKN